MSQRQSLDNRVKKWVNEYLPNMEDLPLHTMHFVRNSEDIPLHDKHLGAQYEAGTQLFNRKVMEAMQNFCDVFKVSASEEIYAMIQVLVYDNMWRRYYQTNGGNYEAFESSHLFEEKYKTPTQYASEKLGQIIATQPETQVSPPQPGLRNHYNSSGYQRNFDSHLWHAARR